MKKSEIRKVYLEKKKTLVPAEISILSKNIFENFIAQFYVKENQIVHCFLSLPEKGEVDTTLFINYFFENNIQVFVPKIIKGKLIALEITAETPLIENSWGIKEPAGSEDCGVKNYDFVITPLLYADQFGNRVGYGKGFYDSFFYGNSKIHNKIGLNFFSPNEGIADVFQKDVALDGLITPSEYIDFTVK